MKTALLVLASLVSLVAADLSLVDKQRVYIEWRAAFKEAKRLAQIRVPKPDGTTDGKLIERHGAAFNKEWDRLIAPTLKRFHIEGWQTERIVVEGVRNHWPEK